MTDPGTPAPPPLPPHPAPAAPLPPRPTAYRSGASYLHVVAGPGIRWWRTLVCVLLAVALLIIGFSLALGGTFAADLALGVPGSFSDIENPTNPLALLFTDLMLLMLIPVSILSIKFAYGVRSGLVTSVDGRFRWGWFGRCVAVTAPGILIAIVVGSVVLGEPIWQPAQWTPHEHAAWLLAFAVFLTPFQAAGEEYAFRGWLMQNVGAVIRHHQAVALGVSVLLSAVLFTLAHGSFDPGIMVSLAVMSIWTVLLTWRTGGLEAAICIHVVNNVLVMFSAIGTGTLADSLIDGATQADWGVVAVDVIMMSIIGATLWHLGGKINSKTP